ncbi:MAG: endo-1,4-beta-xylanase, partial [Pseudomonadota bacterium]|nr:endo-1,4-beta-xylanase [Pseudomonadota bacterium]
MRADPPGLNRRALLAAPFGLAACERFASAQTPAGPLAPPLKSLASFPIGATGMTGQLDDPAWVAAMRRHVDQVTPEWELKPERILQPGFGYDFSASDRMVDWGHEQGLRVFGHCLVWYSQGLDQFTDALPTARFVAEFDRYVSSVAGRYRGRMAGWDVVNEAVAEDGDGLRDCVYARKLGPEAYIVRAFEQARAADPDAVLFLNDYNLENNPRKGAT